ncbi:MAG TPA: alpha/beta fold hydrolase [Opitutaceae bacterium]|nr:alpha/beta fold hydrolase [Opitutaceae bacterium]
MVTAAKLPDWLRRLYPFEPKAFTCSRARMSYVDEGPRSNDAVVLLHGNPTWSFYYRDLILALTGAGLRCVAPDHIGMGLSEKPRNYAYRLAGHIENLGGLIENLGLRHAHLVVHDWGGPIGFGWAIRHPEMVARIVILNTAAFPSPRIPLRINLCRTPLLGAWWIRGLNGFAGPATRMAMHRRAMEADVKRGYQFPYGTWADRIGIARFVADIPMRKTHPSRATLEEIERQLSRFRQNQVLLGWGGADFCFTKRFYNRWLDIFPQSEAHFLSGAGHYVLEDARDELVPKIAAFLNR